MTDALIDPEDIPSLDDVHFGDLAAAVQKVRRHASGLATRGGEIDGAWAADVALNYGAPHGAFLAEKMVPVKQQAAKVADAARTTADALQGYADAGAPIKKSLQQLKRDAESLVARAKPLGDGWRHKPELVAENDRIASAVRNKVAAHDEAVRTAVDKINATNDGPGTNWAERGREYLGFGGFGTTGLGAAVSWMGYYRHGRFAPRGPLPGGGHGYVAWKNEPLWKNTYRRMWSTNWQAKPYAAASRNKWLTVGKWGGRVSLGLTAVTSGLSQWGQDAQDPHMSTGKRVARTGVKATGTTLGAWGGAQAGASAGAAVGAAFGGVGAPVGAVVGGLVGAAAGSGVGSKIADTFNSWLGK
ncbi:hypothetical protein C3486_28145 [Streptomyces sp. Ru73]|uniref:hypothetical protein n=1 Tax=Streptomyces sp. Ru73 TaxID=2080748 RepID=UPI000CDD0849|nr:hypothetical protein [Streptomyces sp. Ru73]POX37466.1 hypothetical protein C3486_28145 [Streptomyces sp. Ru73]